MPSIKLYILIKYIINIIQNKVINEYSKWDAMINNAITNWDKNLTTLDKEYLSSRKPIIVENTRAYKILSENCPENINNPRRIAIPPDEGIFSLCKPLSLGTEIDIGFFISRNVIRIVDKKDMK